MATLQKKKDDGKEIGSDQRRRVCETQNILFGVQMEENLARRKERLNTVVSYFQIEI